MLQIGSGPCVWWSIHIVPYLKYILQAYHDMATHDISDGTGGMDASIRLELDRQEVRLTHVFFLVMHHSVSIRTSAVDLRIRYFS